MDLFEHLIGIGQYYAINVVWKESNFYSNLFFRVGLDPLTLDDVEVIEEDDNLLIPNSTRYEPD
jgi:hypothetical protein